MRNEKVAYKCPVRGEVVSSQEEEKYVIECINYLIDKMGVPVNRIGIKRPLPGFGSDGRNRLEPDLIVFDRPLEESIYNGKVKPEYAVMVVEVKVSVDDREKAIEQQLKPAMRFCRNAKWGIYWDAVTRLAMDPEGKEIPIAAISYKGAVKEQLVLEDLSHLKEGGKIWYNLDLALRTSQGGSKEMHYKEVFKLLISKYYDEKHNTTLDFVIRSVDDPTMSQRIKRLYEDAKKYYRLEGDFGDIVKDPINLNEKALMKCISIMQPYALTITDKSVIQDFYMKFAPQFLKKDLNQFYTPKEIVAFMTNSIQLKKNTVAIDPASGSGDFMVGVLRRGAKEGKRELYDTIHCWDVNPTAATLSQINMILNGDGRSHVRVIDSLDECDKDNGLYDFVIMNPPFGKKTKYDGRNKDRYRQKDKQTGKIFIERGIMLLKNKGILISIIPTGYIDNPSDNEFRELLFNKTRIIGCVNLPSGSFKASGAGGNVSVIFIQKGTSPDNYDIFMGVADHIGFDVTKRNTPPLIKRKEEDGTFLMDENNQEMIENDLLDIEQAILCFTKDEGISGFKSPDKQVSYDVASKQDIENIRCINPKIYANVTGYKNTVKKIRKKKYFRLGEEGVSVGNDDRLKHEPSLMYDYIQTRDACRDNVIHISKLRGWELPNRARQKISKDDIFVVKMENSASGFFYAFSIYDEMLASNGFYKVKIEDAAHRLSFYRFLFCEEYTTQMNALATGSIMGDVKKHHLLNLLYIPLLDDNQLKQIRAYMEAKESFLRAGIW